MGKILMNEELFGIAVEANPTLAGTEAELEGLQIDDIKYKITGGSGASSTKYLKSSGTQYIDTGVVAKGTISVVAEFFLDIEQIDTSESWVNVFCGQDANITNSIDFGYNQSTGGITFQYAGQYGDYNIPILPYEKHTAGLIKGKGFLDYTQHAIFTQTVFSSSQNITLFAGNSGGTIGNYGKLCMTRCKIWDGNTLIRDFIPAVENSVAGLFDKVNNLFYGNDGTGDFVLGEM